ncbi:MAG: heme exporter protein CcmB [SAR324 cluster bacterium]|nr:heme exporter protein CcmB [SAR324 cluster bacterium]
MIFTLEYWRKEFLLHWRQPQKLLSILLLATLMLTLFHFALGARDKQEFSIGIYWVQFLIIGALSLQSIMVSDERAGMSSLIKISKNSPLLVYGSRLVAILIFWAICQGLQLILVGILYDARFLSELGWLFLVVIACGAGFLGLGLSVATAMSNYPFLEFILPLVVFPMVLPIFLSGIQIFEGLLYGEPSISPWLKLLALSDLIFVVGGGILYYLID